MSDHIDRLTLEAYADKLLPAAQRNVVETHVAECSDCQMRLASSQQMSAWLSRMPRERPAPNLSTRINAAIAAQRAPMAARWVRVLVTAAFAAGLALLALSTPEWSSWAQTAAAQLPTGEAMTTWLVSLLTDPAAVLEPLVTLAEPMLAGAAELGALLTLATVLLAVASTAWLAQLLGGEQPRMTTAEMSA